MAVSQIPHTTIASGATTSPTHGGTAATTATTATTTVKIFATPAAHDDHTRNCHSTSMTTAANLQEHHGSAVPTTCPRACARAIKGRATVTACTWPDTTRPWEILDVQFFVLFLQGAKVRRDAGVGRGELLQLGSQLYTAPPPNRQRIWPLELDKNGGLLQGVCVCVCVCVVCGVLISCSSRTTNS